MEDRESSKNSRVCFATVESQDKTPVTRWDTFKVGIGYIGYIGYVGYIVTRTRLLFHKLGIGQKECNSLNEQTEHFNVNELKKAIN